MAQRDVWRRVLPAASHDALQACVGKSDGGLSNAGPTRVSMTWPG